MGNNLPRVKVGKSFGIWQVRMKIDMEIGFRFLQRMFSYIKCLWVFCVINVLFVGWVNILSNKHVLHFLGKLFPGQKKLTVMIIFSLAFGMVLLSVVTITKIFVVKNRPCKSLNTANGVNTNKPVNSPENSKG